MVSECISCCIKMITASNSRQNRSCWIEIVSCIFAMFKPHIPAISIASQYSIPPSPILCSSLVSHMSSLSECQNTLDTFISIQRSDRVVKLHGFLLSIYQTPSGTLLSSLCGYSGSHPSEYCISMVSRLGLYHLLKEREDL